MQARENRGARYRVTNSATPEIHPFIGAHQVRGCIQEKPRPPTRISILSHRRQPWGSGNRTTQCATEIHEKKKTKKEEKERGFAVTSIGETKSDVTANQRKECDARC